MILFAPAVAPAVAHRRAFCERKTHLNRDHNTCGEGDKHAIHLLSVFAHRRVEGSSTERRDDTVYHLGYQICYLYSKMLVVRASLARTDGVGVRNPMRSSDILLPYNPIGLFILQLVRVYYIEDEGADVASCVI